MKIVGLQIYGYGQLENVFINNLNDFQVFFGENEAGKSTIMAFIHGILFGFPTKQQSAELRYEPKNGAKYGGKITLLHQKHGLVAVERTKGKSTGDVKVLLENGMVGNEELLKELLAFFDKNLYQSIFSFNLHGLQNIHQMKGEEIGKFLFSAGTLGTDRLQLTENALQKELDYRFKPGGRKPILNEKIHELHELNGDLKKAAAKNKEFEVLMERKVEIEQRIHEIELNLSHLQQQTEKLTEWKKINQIVKEEDFIKNELFDLGVVSFPARGIERFEQLNQLLLPCNSTISSLKNRIETLEQELESLKPDLVILENESVITGLLDQVPLYEQWALENRQLEMKQSEFDDRLAGIKERLHLTLQDEELSGINTSIYMKEKVEDAARKSRKLEEVKEELESRFQDEKNTLETIETNLLNVKKQLLPENKRRDYEEQMNSGNDKKHLELEWETVKEKIEFYQQADYKEQKFQKQKKQVFLFGEIVLATLLLYGLFAKEWIITLVGIVAMAILAFYMRVSNYEKDKGYAAKLDDLLKREKQLSQKLQTAAFQNLSEIASQIKIDNHHREHLQLLTVKLEQQQNQYEKVITRFEKWEQDYSEHKKKLIEISTELKIPIELASFHLLDAFQLLEQHKLIEREKRQIHEKLNQIQRDQSKLEEGIEHFAHVYLSEQGLNLHKAAFMLRNKLKEEHEKQIKYKEKQETLSELKADFEPKKQEQQELQAEINKLFIEAGVSEEQQYYELGTKAEKYQKLLSRLEDIQKQLEYSQLSETERQLLLQNFHFEDDLKESKKKIQDLSNSKDQAGQELAAIKYEIQVLEEGGVYTELLHRYKQKRFEFEESAKEWAAVALAQDLLRLTIERYKDTHLPRMLEKAEEYLSFLTDGTYRKIHLRESGTGFLIERKDYTLFEANELSQATTEQVYVSIRFALATTLYERYQFPFIIDDSFVNFDEKRTLKVIELMKNIGSHQILFFTCHKHLLKYFQEENVLYLEKGAVLNSFIEY